VQETTHVNICRPALPCTDSIQPPYVYLKAKHYKYLPTKVYPDKQQNSTNPDLKNRKTTTKTFFGIDLAMIEVITCHHDPSSSYAMEILKQDYYNININLHNFVFNWIKI